MSTDLLEWRYCTACAQEQAFETPPGADELWPDAVCTACGTGISGIGMRRDRSASRPNRAATAA
jgi:hypothetical protein